MKYIMRNGKATGTTYKEVEFDSLDDLREELGDLFGDIYTPLTEKGTVNKWVNLEGVPYIFMWCDWEHRDDYKMMKVACLIGGKK